MCNFYDAVDCSSIKDIDYKKDGTRLKRMAETKDGFKPLKDNLETWINQKIKEITDKKAIKGYKNLKAYLKTQNTVFINC